MVLGLCEWEKMGAPISVHLLASSALPSPSMSWIQSIVAHFWQRTKGGGKCLIRAILPCSVKVQIFQKLEDPTMKFEVILSL